MPEARADNRFGHADIVDSTLSEGLTDPQLSYSMGYPGRNVAEMWNITREQKDCFLSRANVVPLPL